MQQTYPFDFIQADVFSLTIDFLKEFDFIWASPPCQQFTRAKYLRESQGNKTKALNLIPQTRELLLSSGKPFVIENVEGAPLFKSVYLCGSMFGLKVRRHRIFECNFPVHQLKCKHKQQGKPIGVYHRLNDKIPHGGKTASSLAEARDAMGISYMNWNELKESIPPLYSKYIINQFLNGEANKEIEIIKSRQLGYDEGKTNKEAYVKQKQLEAYEDVLKWADKESTEELKRGAQENLISYFDLTNILEQRIKELRK
jgi:DNA (cytosine-5)-methyltransferase 1